MRTQYWHPATGAYYTAQTAPGVVGLNPDNCEANGFFVPVLAEKPVVGLGQIARLNYKPDLIGGTYVRGWTVEALPEGDVLNVRLAAAAAECSRRIYAEADQTAQMNMASAASAGLLTDDQMTAWRMALGWVAQMRAAWRPIATDITKTITDDAHWPDCPAAVKALADGF